MAVDTKNKRSSAIFPGSPWRGMLPAPDGTIDQGDRQATAFVYSGIEAGAPVVESAEPGLDYTIPDQKLHYTVKSEGRLHYRAKN